MRRVTGWAVAAGMLLAAGLMMAGCHLFCPAKSPQERINMIADKLAKELNLTAEQKTKFDTLKAELQKKQEELAPDRQAMLAEIKGQILSDKVDQEKLNQLFAGRQAKREELRKFLIAKFAEFHDMLTPAQRVKLADLMEKMHKRFMPERK